VVLPVASSRDIEQAIARYCAAHSHSADTADGVRRMWLADPSLPLALVEAALESLVKRGVISARRLSDGTAVYFTRGALR